VPGRVGALVGVGAEHARDAGREHQQVGIDVLRERRGDRVRRVCGHRPAHHRYLAASKRRASGLEVLRRGRGRVFAQGGDEQACVQSGHADADPVEFDLVGPEFAGGGDVLARDPTPADDDAEFVSLLTQRANRIGVGLYPVGVEVGREDAPADGDDHLHRIGLSLSRS